MVSPIARTDDSHLGIWWWTVDRWLLWPLLSLLFLGIIFSFSASPSIAEHLHLSSFHFVIRQAFYTSIAVLLMLGISLLSVNAVRRLGFLLFILSLGLILITLYAGSEIKGATRWLSVGGFSMQPSEFLKPAFAIVSAWMFTEKRLHPDTPGILISFVFYVISVGLLIAQPDLGMVVVITLTWLAQFFVAGLSRFWILIAMGSGVLGLSAAYFFLPHVTKRIDQFLYGSGSDRFTDQYQIMQSLKSFAHGHLMGQGPGEGTVKKYLPDAHSDFVFAVIGEEYGFLICMIIACVFLFIVMRSLYRIINENNLFVILAVSGLAAQFGIQALVNMASSINLIPTKGMTLPFISYGGSSTFAVAITVGMILALTRRRVEGAGNW
jgi:cell division protein FtsW